VSAAEVHPPGYFDREYFRLHPGKERYLRWLLRLLRRHGVRGGRVLDLGAGYGFWLAALARAGYEPAGVELSPEAALVAHQRSGAPVATGSADAPLPYEDGNFAAVTMLDVIEHLARYDAALAECARVLAPGGKLFVVTLNAGSLARPLLGRRWSFWLDPTHVHMFSARRLRDAFAAAGLQTERLTTMSNFALVGEGNPFLKPLRRVIGRVVLTPWLGDSLLGVARKPVRSAHPTG
jgi:2-polyprenyl-3-methyl-5-hydroxy-6-metoxy-1,4-benzoquinol methylase